MGWLSVFEVGHRCIGSAKDGKRQREGLVALKVRMRDQKDLINIMNHPNGIPFLPTLVFLSHYDQEEHLDLN